MRDSLKRSRSVAFWTWVVVTGAVSALVLGRSPEAQVTPTLMGLGLVLAGSSLAAFWVNNQVRSLAALVVFAWAATFGLWFPEWHNAAGPTVAEWLSRLTPSTGGTPELLSTPAAIASAGLATAALLYVATGSGGTFLQVGAASLIASVAPLLPLPHERACAVAAIAWNSMCAASLLCWSVGSVRRRLTVPCPHCGFDVDAIGKPVCTGCGHRLIGVAACGSPMLVAPAAKSKWF